MPQQRDGAMSNDEPTDDEGGSASDHPEETCDGRSGDIDGDPGAPDHTPSCSGLQSGCDTDEAIVG